MIVFLEAHHCLLLFRNEIRGIIDIFSHYSWFDFLKHLLSTRLWQLRQCYFNDREKILFFIQTDINRIGLGHCVPSSITACHYLMLLVALDKAIIGEWILEKSTSGSSSKKVKKFNLT